MMKQIQTEQQRPDHHKRRQGKTNNISLRHSQTRRTRKPTSQFDTSTNKTKDDLNEELDKVEENTVERFKREKERKALRNQQHHNPWQVNPCQVKTFRGFSI
ncbi:hypothetical protein MTR67_031135 [Solanum verrucosum]|uniref:Uncharacterized protein n=1 Tax=Solanum verrucosum TaxID=315347 RepID=A0AAF0U1V5_SOLVR|nr:hypothetical protein MTR67_031135 [Solanum verrucosum]